jgi:hypothetical protein
MLRKIYLRTDDEMEITKREIIVSISIIAVMIVIGLLISGGIEDHQSDLNAKYNKAIHITTMKRYCIQH